MTEADRQRLESELPPGWKIMAKITQGQLSDGFPANFGNSVIRAESAVHNVVLEGTWSWIKRKAVAYALSAQGGN